MSYYIGLMSGTSMDAVDAALVEIAADRLTLKSSLTFPYPDTLQRQLRSAIEPNYKFSLEELGELDAKVAEIFAAAGTALLKRTGLSPKKVAAIGSHGQTLHHSPDSSPPHTTQIGNGAIIAAHTKIDTVSDFRTLDVALGGQGAPLVPAFHEWLFRSPLEERVIVNIGGIANITALPKDPGSEISGFDTGPGNCLLDEWCQKFLGKDYDYRGEWAASGTCDAALLAELGKDDYFQAPIPKSTGRDKFNLAWLENILQGDGFKGLKQADVQATLLALTVQTISAHIQIYTPTAKRVFVCGGGAFNDELLKQLKTSIPTAKIETTGNLGIDPGMIEACAFAWFAHCRKTNKPVKLTTGGNVAETILGALTIAPS